MKTNNYLVSSRWLAHSDEIIGHADDCSSSPVSRQRKWRTCGLTMALLMSAGFHTIALAATFSTKAIGAAFATNSTSVLSATSFGNGAVGLSGPKFGPFTARDDYQEIFTNQNNEPVLGALASATLFVESGRISAFASAEMTGTSLPGPSKAAGAAAEATIFDSFSVRSATLPDGTPVDLNFVLAVDGSGFVVADYRVERDSSCTRNCNPNPGSLHLQHSMQIFDGTGGIVSGVIHAEVGEFYAIEYSLKVAAAVTSFNMRNQTKFSVSDYSHTAHYFATPSLAAVRLAVTSGFDYTAPAPVPVPAVGWMMWFPALLIARRRARNCLGLARSDDL